MKTQKKTYIFALVPFLLLCLLFEIIPVIFTVIRSFFPEGGDMGFTLDNYINIFTGKTVSAGHSQQSAHLDSFFGYRAARGIYRCKSSP